MNTPELGFLLLCCHLGVPSRPVLTGPQLRTLTQRVRQAKKSDPDRHMNATDLVMLGYSREDGERILGLLSDEELLKQYVKAGKKAGCIPVALTSPDYPRYLKYRLREDSPGCLWAKGDMSILNEIAISVIGSRTPTPQTQEFAMAAGEAAARQGLVLVSGNAQGVDSLAQEAALSCGGRVISVVADDLAGKKKRKNVLYLAEQDYEVGFSASRALSRNRIIHCMGQKVLAAQCRVGKGGTWNGTVNNLKKGWSPVFCFDDGSEGSAELQARGARLITMEDLKDLKALALDQQSIF